MHGHGSRNRIEHRQGRGHDGIRHGMRGVYGGRGRARAEDMERTPQVKIVHEVGLGSGGAAAGGLEPGGGGCMPCRGGPGLDLPTNQPRFSIWTKMTICLSLRYGLL